LHALFLMHFKCFAKRLAKPFALLFALPAAPLSFLNFLAPFFTAALTFFFTDAAAFLASFFNLPTVFLSVAFTCACLAFNFASAAPFNPAAFFLILAMVPIAFFFKAAAFFLIMSMGLP